MKFIDSELIDPAVEPEGEKFGRAARSIIGSIPVLGAAATELFNGFFEGPLSKRRTEWMLQVTEVINEVIERGVVTEKSLMENEVFISAVAQACNAALRTHQEEKLLAFRNVLLNAAVRTSNHERVEFFIYYLDLLTVAHLKVLSFVRDPDQWLIDNCVYGEDDWKSVKGTHGLIMAVHPDYHADKALYDVVWQDLYRCGLINEKTEDLSDPNSSIYTALTSVGEAFLDFIEPPKHSKLKTS